MNHPLVSRKKWVGRGALSLLTVGLALAATDWAISAATEKGDKSGKGLSLEFVPGDKDKATYKVLKETLDENAEGVWSHLRERGVQYISPQEALARALRKNLSLRVGSAEAAKAAMAVQQADAVFDPTFVLDVGRSESMTYERKGFGPVYQRSFRATPTPPGLPYLDIPTAGTPDPEINRIGYLGPQDAGTVEKEFLYSKRQTNGPSVSYAGGLTVSQQLPWGPQLRLTHGVSYRLVDYDDQGHSYDRPYGSSVGLNVFLPLPGTKNFGRFAPQDVAQEQARLARERGDLVLRGAIESTLLEVDMAYWGLVQSLENLMSAIENRKAAQEQADYAGRMLDLGRTTQYGKSQMDAELARARVLEESARDLLINASYTLAILVENDQEAARSAILLPAGYQERLLDEMAINSKDAREKALAQRAAIKVGLVDINSRELNLRFRENQALPDVTVAGNFNQGQDNATYGYKGYADSLVNLTNPDSRSMGGSVTFVRAIGNRAANAQLAQAQEYANQSQLSVDSVRRDVVKEVDDALASVSSARTRKASARRNEELAAQTLGKLRNRAEAVGDVPELEITLKLRDLFKARTSRVSAQVDAKKAEVRLLAAQGVLAENLAQKTALDEFDQYRIQLLAESHAVPFFSAFSFGRNETVKP